MSWGYDDDSSAPRAGSQSSGWGDVGGSARPPAGAGWGAGAVEPSRSSEDETVGAPVVLLLVGLVVAAAGLATGLLTNSATVATIGWAVAGPVAVGIFGLALKTDTQRRSRSWYRESPGGNWLRRLLILVSVAGVAANAWVIADSVARGIWT